MMMKRLAKMASGMMAWAHRRSGDGWQKPDPQFGATVGLAWRVKLLPSAEFRGDTGVVCYMGCGHADTVHVVLDKEQGKLGQQRRYTHIGRIKAAQPPNNESRRIWSKYTKSGTGWSPLVVGDCRQRVSGRSS